MNRNREYEARLIRIIRNSFSRDELQYDLYVSLLISYNEMEGETQKAKATELVKKCARDGRLPQLLTACRNLRPHIKWPDPEKQEIDNLPPATPSSTTLKDIPNILWVLSGAIVVLIAWAGSVWLGNGGVPEPTATPTMTTTAVILPSNTPSPTPTNIPTTTPIPATNTPPPTKIISPTPTKTAAPTATKTAAPTATTVPTTAPTATRTPYQPPRNPVLGDWWVRNTDEMYQFFVPADTFWMGSLLDTQNANKDEFPQHEVILSPFWLDKTEVTAAQFADFLNVAGNQREHGAEWISLDHSSRTVIEDDNTFFAVPGMDNKPVALVTWYGANAYCQWAGGQLPTEAQWEYAARGPQLRSYPWGNLPPTCDQAQFRVCPDGAQGVGSKSPEGDSWLGAVDMGGNMWEWTADWYGKYETAVSTNPTGRQTGSSRVLRGGSWGGDSWMTRTAYRYYAIPTYHSVFHGFRCVVPHSLHVYDNNP